MSRCIGLGRFENNCPNLASKRAGRLSPWCKRCDDLRIARIAKRLRAQAEEAPHA